MKKLLKIASIFMIIIMNSACVNRLILFRANNDAFNYIGRFDKSSKNAVRFDWPNSTIEFQFSGNKLELALQGGEKNYFNIFIDNKLHQVLHQPNDSIIQITEIESKGIHKLRLQKRTEGEMGIAIFKGVYLPRNKNLIATKIEKTKKIEFIGNSITCGYGTEGLSKNENFLPATENVNKSYALIISEAFNAESHIIAHSGLGVVRNYGDKNSVSTDRATMPNRYNRVIDTDDRLKWDFNLWKPDMVVVNLGTNDYSTQPHPDKTIFQQTYLTLLEQIQKTYGEIPIFLISGPIIEEPAHTNIKEIVNNSKELNPNLNLHFIGIPKKLLNNTTDLGSDSHPSHKGQIKIANYIMPYIAKVMNWVYNIN